MNPRELERYNPFAAERATEREADLNSDPKQPFSSQAPFASQARRADTDTSGRPKTESPVRATSGRYSTSFPDPFGLDEAAGGACSPPSTMSPSAQPARSQPPSNRSNSVTFLHRLGADRDDDDQPAETSQGRPSPRGARQTSGGFTSFLSRATSVTSSSVTDRVSGAVGSVRSAVDSLSNQFQQATAAPSQEQPAGLSEAGRQQSTASYLASRLSSATNQFVGGSAGALSSAAQLSGSQDGQTATICRQRVVLILDNPEATDWAQQFNQYRRLISGLAPQSSTSLAFTSFLAAQFSSSSGGLGGQSDGLDGDLIEQVSFKTVSVLANQSSAAAAVNVTGPAASASQSFSSSLPINRLALNIVGSSLSQQPVAAAQQHQQQANQQTPFAKTIRPEYVVVRQRGREHLNQLKGIVKALNYCCVPMFEPYEVWSVFQDRQQIFARLLRVQRQLGKERFPLIPQVFCQTHQDLLNYITNSQVSLPCLVRTGPLGKGRIRVDSLQMLKDFATIMATSDQSCTIEQYLDVKCDLIVQKLGTSLKLFKGKVSRTDSLPNSAYSSLEVDAEGAFSLQQQRPQAGGQDSYGRQAASRQTSLGGSGGGGGGGGLFGLVSTGGGGTQLARNNSNPASSSAPTGQTGSFEKMAEVNARYRQWVEAIVKEFDNKIDVFCIKIVIAGNDREYIVGMRDCSMDFLGNQENQDEDRRSLVELIISKMNTILPKHQPVSREPSASDARQRELEGGEALSSAARATNADQAAVQSKTLPSRFGQSDKRAALLGHASATSNSQPGLYTGPDSPLAPSGQMLNNRNRSVSMNQGEPLRPLGQAEWTSQQQAATRQSSGRPQQPYLPRRASDRSDSMLTGADDLSAGSPSSGSSMGPGARQQSLGQSFFDQTSTALSSFQRQSLGFLRRLDARTGAELSSGTPPLSAKSDTGFDRQYSGGLAGGLSNGASLDRTGYAAGSRTGATGGVGSIKSQSVDVHAEARRSPAHPPPKPPPPSSALVNRQSSLANYSSSSIGQQRATLSQQPRVRSESSKTNPITPQNSISLSSFSSERQPSRADVAATSAAMNGQQQQRQQRVVRQNSALSAFEPFDASLRSETYQDEDQQVARVNKEPSGVPLSTQASGNNVAAAGSPSRQLASGGGVKYDTVSMKSANSNTSDETTTAEDTMNNLKKTFASIFGDKCE